MIPHPQAAPDLISLSSSPAALLYFFFLRIMNACTTSRASFSATERDEYQVWAAPSSKVGGRGEVVGAGGGASMM